MPVIQTRCLVPSKSLQCRPCLRQIDALLGLRSRGMGRIRGRSIRALQPSDGLRISVRDNLDSHRIPAIDDGTGGGTLRCDVESPGQARAPMGGPSGSGFARLTSASHATSRPTWNGNPITSGTVTRSANLSFILQIYSEGIRCSGVRWGILHRSQYDSRMSAAALVVFRVQGCICIGLNPSGEGGGEVSPSGRGTKWADLGTYCFIQRSNAD